MTPRNPAETVLKAGYVYEPPHPDKRIVVEAKEVLRSDAESYHFSTTVEVTVDGDRFFDRSWNVTVPRELG